MYVILIFYFYSLEFTKSIFKTIKTALKNIAMSIILLYIKLGIFERKRMRDEKHTNVFLSTVICSTVELKELQKYILKTLIDGLQFTCQIFLVILKITQIIGYLLMNINLMVILNILEFGYRLIQWVIWNVVDVINKNDDFAKCLFLVGTMKCLLIKKVFKCMILPDEGPKLVFFCFY